MDSNKLLGYCKECGNAIFESNRIANYEIFECSNCSYLSCKGDIWDYIPYYIKK